MNTLKVTFLLALLSGLFIVIGQSLGGTSGAQFALILSLAMTFGSYWFSDTIVLKMHRAKEVTKATDPKLVSMVERLAHKAGLPVPKVYILPSSGANAFATGRDPHHSAVAVTQGIMTQLSDNELSGVIGHELAHIKNRDILISSIAAAIGGAISMLANMAQWAFIFGRGNERDDNAAGTFFTMLIAPITATLIQLAISRSREFEADRVGAEIHGNPLDLASALHKLHTSQALLPAVSNSTATAHMFILSPLKGKNVLKLFSTHPPVEERIKRLQAM